MDEKMQLEKLIMDGAFALSKATGSGVDLTIPGVRGWYSSFSEAYANRVGLLSQDNIDTRIKEVLGFFKGQNKGFTWVVSPSEIEIGLPEKLMSFGLVPGHCHQLEGMCLEAPFSFDSSVLRSIEIREVTPQQILDNQELYSNAYGVPESIVRHLFYPDTSSTLPSRNYMVFCRDEMKPVGFGISVYLEGGSVVLLKGSGILPEFRGRGIYRAMLERRICDAGEGNIKTILIHADRSSSYETCKKMGFKRVCSTELYQWIPDSKSENYN